MQRMLTAPLKHSYLLHLCVPVNNTSYSRGTVIDQRPTNKEPLGHTIIHYMV